MTNAQTEALIAQANEMDANADMLDAALLAPSMKADTLREEAQALREKAAA